MTAHVEGGEAAKRVEEVPQPHRSFGRPLGVRGACRVRFTEATSQPTSGVPYSSRPYCRSVKLRLLSVQMRMFPGPSRYMSCASDPRKTPATIVFDPPSAAVI